MILLTTLTGDPAEKADHDVLETMLLLDKSGDKLPVGLRVVVQFLELESDPAGK